MNSQRPYGQQGMQRPLNQAGPAIRAGLSVQELKAMTAMRVGHDDPSKVVAGTHDYPTGGAYRNPASSYQTATPQQLQAAGITPVVINDRPMVRQKSSTLNSFPVYAASNSYPDQDLIGQNRPYNYDDMRAPMQSRVEAPHVNTSTYAKATSTAYNQNTAIPNRGGAPQINSVEDVKEMTRLRMLMSERDAFFESSGSSSRNAGEPNSLRSGGSDYESGGFEENRLAAPRYSGLSTGPSVNTSTDSYDSYDFPATAIDARSPTFRAAASSSGGVSLHHQTSSPQLNAQQKPLYASQQQQSAYAPMAQQGYGVASGSPMLHSNSVGGLGVRGTNVLGQSSNHQQTSPLYSGFTTSGSTSGGSPSYQQQSATRGLIGSTVRPPVHSTTVVGNGSLGLPPTSGSASLSLTGSSVIGARRAPAPLGSSTINSSTSSLSPLTGRPAANPLYGSSQQSSLYQQGSGIRADLDASIAREPPRMDRGIERDLMLSAQFTLGHDIFEENVLRGQDPNLRSQMLDHSGGSNSMRGGGGNASHQPLNTSSILGAGPRAGQTGYTSGSGYQMNNNQRSDLSLNSLLGEVGPYQRAGAQVVSPMERSDNLFDLLSSEGISVPGRNHNGNHGGSSGAHISSSPFLSGLSSSHNDALLRSPRELEPLPISQKMLLGPLSDIGANSPSPVKRDTSSSPLQLAPLSPVDVSPTKNKAPNPAISVVPRKLSSVGKAATYNNAVSSSKKELDGSIESAKVSGGVGHRMQAFGDRAESLDGSTLLNGIASPSRDSMDDSSAPQMAHLSPSQQQQATPSPSGKYPMVKAHTTSRIPTDTSPSSAITPKLMRIKSKLAGAHGLECTPPGSALDRSDSGNMNYLASEMAEMVLDYSSNYELGVDSRDNSNDLNRILAAMSGSTEGMDSPSALAFKRSLSNTSVGFNE